MSFSFYFFDFCNCRHSRQYRSLILVLAVTHLTLNMAFTLPCMQESRSVAVADGVASTTQSENRGSTRVRTTSWLGCSHNSCLKKMLTVALNQTRTSLCRARPQGIYSGACMVMRSDRHRHILLHSLHPQAIEALANPSLPRGVATNQNPLN